VDEPRARQGERARAAAILAEHNAPAGVHVATVTVADPIGPGTALDPDAVAERYRSPHAQPCDAWQEEVVVTRLAADAH
jgi:hypothetical protein